jgi:hypothetical protein
VLGDALNVLSTCCDRRFDLPPETPELTIRHLLPHRRAAADTDCLARAHVRTREVDSGGMRQRTVSYFLRAIADSLNRDGIPAAQGGGRWYAATVSGIFARNP